MAGGLVRFRRTKSMIDSLPKPDERFNLAVIKVLAEIYLNLSQGTNADRSHHSGWCYGCSKSFRMKLIINLKGFI